MKRIALALLCLLSLAGLLPASESLDFRWEGVLQSAQRIEIRNVAGNIRAEAATGDAAEVTATITGTHPDEIYIDVQNESFGVVITAVFPDNSDSQVDFVVRVPSGIALYAGTVAGSIDLKLPDNLVEAAVVAGRIAAWLGRINTSGTSVLSVVNGAVDVELPADVDAHVHAQTIIGGILTDFPLRVRWSLVGRTLDGNLGHGGPRLELSTVLGGIHLKKAIQ